MTKNVKAADRPSSKMKQAPPIPKFDMNVKCYVQRNWRRDVRVFQTDNRSDYRKFVKSVKSTLKMRDNEHIVIKWMDNSGDLVTLYSDLEFRLATKQIRQNDTLNVCVQMLEELPTPTLCDVCDQTIVCTIRYKCEMCANFVCCVRCYQTAQIKTMIHEHELYKEKFPCYCPMHRIRESHVDERPLSALPTSQMQRLGLGGRPHSMMGDRSRSLPNYVDQVPYEVAGSGGGGSGGGGRGRTDSMDDMMRHLNPSAPSSPGFNEDVPSEHNYRTAERCEVVRGPNGDVYRQQQMSVLESPGSGVVAIRTKRSRESRSKSHQLG